MKENIKIGLLGLIALTLIVNTFFMNEKPSRYSVTNMQPTSNIAASPVVSTSNNTSSNIVTPPSIVQNTNEIGQLSQSRAKTSIQFKEKDHDFGKVDQDTKNKKVFEFTNTGKEPLIIENAKGSCGCTVPTYPREPIKPGDTGEIEVVYNPGKQQGTQNKTVTITANTNPTTTILNISADVQIVQ